LAQNLQSTVFPTRFKSNLTLLILGGKMKKPLCLILVVTFILSTVLIVSVPAGADQGPQIRVTDSQARADQPDVAMT
jgi:hypothetical protein